MTIGNRIAELRKAKGFTQEYVADQLGVSRQAVSKWEQDQTSPDTKNLIALAQLLDTDISFLAMGTSSRASSKMDERMFRATIDTKTTTGYILLVLGIIFLLLIPFLGIVLLIIAIVCLAQASQMEKALPKPPTKPRSVTNLPPWVCYTCGEENEGRVQYCLNCQTYKGWSEQKQLEKKEKL
jgi:transcriptional regulator with XRE-family HTH domain